MSLAAPGAAGSAGAGAGAAAPPRAACGAGSCPGRTTPRNVALSPAFIVHLASENVKGRCQLAHAPAQALAARKTGPALVLLQVDRRNPRIPIRDHSQS